MITDARQNEAMRHVFAMGGRALWQKSCDAGQRWMLGDVGGAPLRAWDERGHTKRATYDAARRATHAYVQQGTAAEQLVGRTVYGEGHPSAMALNLRGKAYQVYDGAGVVTSGAFDFKGNLLHGSRRLAADYTYDAAGQRVRKVWEHSGLIEERIYLGGWEVYRKRDSLKNLLVERETLHGMDGARRIVLVETKTVDVEAGGAFAVVSRLRFQLDNHLGSASLEVDESGLVIGYEEYHPYGTAAYASGRGGVEVLTHPLKSARRFRGKRHVRTAVARIRS